MPHSLSKHWDTLALRIVEDTVSVKFYILVMSSVFFYIGRLEAKDWVELMLFIAGFKTLNNMVAIKANVVTTASGEPKNGATTPPPQTGNTNGTAN